VPTSAQYGLDNLYASDKLFATSDVIDKAADTWVLGSGESRCTSEFKNELKFPLRNETDFEKHRPSGRPARENATLTSST